MQTIEQLEAKHAAAKARLEAEHALARKAQFPPDSVQISASLAPWLVYRKRPLADALAMFKASQVVPQWAYKSTFTRLQPESKATAKDGARGDGPFAVALNVDSGDGYGPNLEVKFFTMAGDTLCLAVIDIEGPDYIGAFGALRANAVEIRDRRTDRLESRHFNPNHLLNGLTDKVISWASGDSGPIKTSAAHTYLLMCDQDETATGADNAHACDQLQNLIDATAPRP